AASHTPQVILFGPTNPFHWRPTDSPALILHGKSGAVLAPDGPRMGAAERRLDTKRKGGSTARTAPRLLDGLSAKSNSAPPPFRSGPGLGCAASQAFSLTRQLGRG